MLMFDVSRLYFKIRNLCKKNPEKSISQLGEMLGISAGANRQAKAKKVKTTVMKIMDSMMALECIAIYLETTPEYLLLEEEIYRQLFSSRRKRALFTKILQLYSQDDVLAKGMFDRSHYAH